MGTTAPGTIRVTGPEKVNSLVIPSNIHVEFANGGMLVPSGTVTWHGTHNKPLFRIYSTVGSGRVVYNAGSVDEVHPEWWSRTGGIREAVAAAGGVAPILLQQRKYIEKQKILNTAKGVVIRGGWGERHNPQMEGIDHTIGTSIEFAFDDALFENGRSTGYKYDCSDCPEPKSNYLYRGPQGFTLENVHIRYVGPVMKPLANGQGTYGENAIGFRDWYGGDIRMRNVVFENLRHAFWGVHSDINHFHNVQARYCKEAIYAGPRSDQFVIDSLYAWECDQAVIVDNANVRILFPQIVGCGYRDLYPIEVKQDAAIQHKTVLIDQPWFEKYQGTTSHVTAFIGVGVNPGYNGTSNSPRVRIMNPNLFTSRQEDPGFPGQPNPYGFTKYLAEIGKGLVEIYNVDGDTSNLSHLVSFVGPYKNYESQCMIYGASYLAGKAFVNNGTGVKDMYLNVWGSGGNYAYGPTNRLFGRTYPPQPKRDWSLYSHADGQFVVDFPDYGGDNPIWLSLNRRMYTGGATSGTTPAAGTFEKGDIVFHTDPQPGGYVGKVCVEAGTEGTFGEKITATSDGSKMIRLSAPTKVLKPGIHLDISGNVCTIASVAGTAVTCTTPQVTKSAVLGYRRPVWKEFGRIEQ